MSPPPPPPPPPPPHPSTNCHLLLHKPSNIFFTAFSLFFLFSSSSSKPRIPFLSFPQDSRRFLKFPFMSLSHHHHPFPTPQSLSDWLKPRLPSDSFASWGVKPGTKNVHNLWLELHQGETSLADSTPPVRTVNVVTVRVLDQNNRILVETHQELSDGSVRERWRPLSEKMKPNETAEAAAFRAIKEELGRDSASVRIVPGSFKEKVEERNSASYPGLPARYMLHSVDVSVEGLPPGDEFCTAEVDEYPNCEHDTLATADKAVSVRRHFWKWVSPDSVQS